MELNIKYDPIYQPLFDGKFEIACIHGGRNSCKSWMAALYCCLICMAESKTRVWAGREVQSSIKESSHQTVSEVIEYFKLPGWTVKDSGIYFSAKQSEIFFMGLRGGSKREEATRTKSLENVRIFWGEEAQSFTKESLELIEPTLRKENSQIIYTFNRLFLEDPVFKRHCIVPDKTKLILSVNYYDVPGYVSKKSYREAEKLKEENYDEWLHIYGGEPRPEGEKTVISIRQVQEAIVRQPDSEGQVTIGVDVARYGTDKTVFVKRKGHHVQEIKSFRKMSLTQVYSELKAFGGNDCRYIVDDSGIGGGLTDMLQRDNYNVTPVNFGSKAYDSDKYNNRVSELWFELPINLITIPDHDQLKVELTTRQYKYDTKDRRCIEKKEDYKKRGYNSPDYADALILAFAEPINFDWSAKIETGK